ncbi:hypothetical protein NDU88_007373 [Pleurodeles waltl]|uniref:Uncharacterized protein n=1 Tax=Pleurodeles waltl TaxID=8319 RepID=A0AAV7SSK2_PLEWA|nr:hypothetical protein NDU88_007373 [Pleurodeles waltl]
MELRPGFTVGKVKRKLIRECTDPSGLLQEYFLAFGPILPTTSRRDASPVISTNSLDVTSIPAESDPVRPSNSTVQLKSPPIRMVLEVTSCILSTLNISSRSFFTGGA